MKRVKLLIMLAVVLHVTVRVSESHAQSPAAAEEVGAIKALMVQTTDAFNRHDAKAWASFCAPDAQLVTVRGESMKGVAEIEKGLAAIFETRGRAAKLKTLETAVRFVRPDVALAHVINEMSGVTGSDGRPLPSHRELSTRVLVKHQGTWHITAFHNTVMQQ